MLEETTPNDVVCDSVLPRDDSIRVRHTETKTIITMPLITFLSMKQAFFDSVQIEVESDQPKNRKANSAKSKTQGR